MSDMQGYPPPDPLPEGYRVTRVTDDSLPWGTTRDERLLFRRLNALRDQYAYNFGMPPDSMVSPWELVRIVACMPDTYETMLAILGPSQHEFYIQECVDEVRIIKGLPSLRPSVAPIGIHEDEPNDF